MGKIENSRCRQLKEKPDVVEAKFKGLFRRLPGPYDNVGVKFNGDDHYVKIGLPKDNGGIIPEIKQNTALLIESEMSKRAQKVENIKWSVTTKGGKVFDRRILFSDTVERSPDGTVVFKNPVETLLYKAAQEAISGESAA